MMRNMGATTEHQSQEVVWNVRHGHDVTDYSQAFPADYHEDTEHELRFVRGRVDMVFADVVDDVEDEDL